MRLVCIGSACTHGLARLSQSIVVVGVVQSLRSETERRVLGVSYGWPCYFVLRCCEVTAVVVALRRLFPTVQRSDAKRARHLWQAVGSALIIMINYCLLTWFAGLRTYLSPRDFVDKVVATPVLEEMLFRGVFLGAMLERLSKSPRFCVFAQAVIFAPSPSPATEAPSVWPQFLVLVLHHSARSIGSCLKPNTLRVQLQMRTSCVRRIAVAMTHFTFIDRIAFACGLAYGANVAVTGTLWIVVLLHSLHNALSAFFFQNWSTIPCRPLLVLWVITLHVAAAYLMVRTVCCSEGERALSKSIAEPISNPTIDQNSAPEWPLQNGQSGHMGVRGAACYH